VNDQPSLQDNRSRKKKKAYASIPAVLNLASFFDTELSRSVPVYIARPNSRRYFFLSFILPWNTGNPPILPLFVPYIFLHHFLNSPEIRRDRDVDYSLFSTLDSMQTGQVAVKGNSFDPHPSPPLTFLARVHCPCFRVVLFFRLFPA